jgi:hypothetical protein
MTLVVQDETGLVDGANAYIDRVYFKEYHDARGNDYSAFSDPQIDASIVRATDYQDQRFQFIGVKANPSGQTTEWPRIAGTSLAQPWLSFDLVNSPVVLAVVGSNTVLRGPSGEEITGIPDAVKKATAEYAFRALSISLFEDAPAPSGGVAIESITQKVDVIEQSIKYSGGGQVGVGTFVMPSFPSADMLLVRAGLVMAGRTLYR